MKRIFLLFTILIYALGSVAQGINTLPLAPSAAGPTDYFVGYRNTGGNLVTYRYNASTNSDTLRYSIIDTILGVTYFALDSGLATRMNALTIRDVVHGTPNLSFTMSPNQFIRFRSVNPVTTDTLILPNRPLNQTLDGVKYISSTNGVRCLMMAQGGQKFTNGTSFDTISIFGESRLYMYNNIDSTWTYMWGSKPSPTIDAVLTTGDIASQGIYFKRPSDSLFTLYAGQRRQNGLDGSGQILLYDTAVAGVQHAELSMAASNNTQAASIHGFGGGTQLVSTHNDFIITANNADLPTSAVLQLNDMRSNKINLYPASIKFTDGQFSAGNSLNIVNNRLSGSRVQYLPDATGIVGVAIFGKSIGLVNSNITGLVNFTVDSEATYQISVFVNVTTSTVHSFTAVCNYTDETNTARVETFNFSNLAGTISPTIANAGGAVPYHGLPITVHCKGGTPLSVGTAPGGTYTGVVYDIYSSVTQVGH